jgi:uncharacterized membrane protein YhhN
VKKRFWITLFLVTLLIDIAAVYLRNEILSSVAKPLLMPLLVFYFILNTNNFISPLKKWIVLALVFSWAGDVLLMFESMNPDFFMSGLAAFLIAHFFYILFYESIIRSENIKKNYWWFIPVLIYYVSIIYILSPHLGDMKLPVRIYGIVISYMLIQALQTAMITNQNAAGLMIAGSVLFIASDSLLAINKFHGSFEDAGIAIMLTYGIAQLLITLGAVRYITSISKQ